MNRKDTSRTGATLTSDPRLGDGKQRLHFLILYEDLAAGKRAKELCDYIAFELGTDCVVLHSAWRFDVIETSGLRSAATHDAMDADLIIVAPSGDRLSPPMQRWMETWVRHTKSNAALVGLCPAEDAEDSVEPPLSAQLQALADLGQISYFPKAWEDEETGTTDASAATDTASNRLAALDLDMGDSKPRWTGSD